MHSRSWTNSRTPRRPLPGWPAGSLARRLRSRPRRAGSRSSASADAVLAFVPYPFFVQHAAELHLTPLVQADVADVGRAAALDAGGQIRPRHGAAHR